MPARLINGHANGFAPLTAFTANLFKFCSDFTFEKLTVPKEERSTSSTEEGSSVIAKSVCRDTREPDHAYSASRIASPAGGGSRPAKGHPSRLTLESLYGRSITSSRHEMICDRRGELGNLYNRSSVFPITERS